MILEDLQWASVSLEAFACLVSLLADLPILLVGSYRGEEVRHLPQQLGDVNVLKLEKLSYENVAALSESMLGSRATTPEVTDMLYRETEGNAFFMVEVVRALAEEAGQLSQVGEFELPASVFTGGMQQISQRRLKRVPNWAYGGLQVAAVMGRKLNLDVLDKILSPILNLLTGDDVSASLSTVWREGRHLNLDDWLLVCADDAILEIHEGYWRFTHDKLREQILADLDSDQMELIRRQVERFSDD